MDKMPPRILIWLVLGTSTALSGCAAPPDIIAEEPPAKILPGEVQAQPDRFTGERVRWGGVILDTENKKDTTVLTVLAYPLGDTARPQIQQSPLGRFQARLSGFRDPAVYQEQREITVIGALSSVIAAKVGDFEYDYPVVEVDKYYLWQPRPAYPDDHYHYYDPFWDPFYPYYRYYPYYYPRRHIEGIKTQ